MMDPKDFLNEIISDLIGNAHIEGKKFGLELELEGKNVGLNDVAARGWKRNVDGSLRGESIEYTTAGPKPLGEAQSLVTELFDKFKKNGVKLNDSIRTSTHVHLNFSDQPVKNVINFFALFTMFEELLQYYSGEDRKGNLFCISTREAEGIVGIVADCLAKGDLSRFAGDRYKYAACNLSTLYKFGTVEVRTMRGASSAEMVNAWVDILSDMFDFAVGPMRSPATLVNDLSILGAEGLMKKIFKRKNLDELMLYFPKIQTLHYSLMEGARLIQIFAYEFDEAFLAPFDPKPKKKEGKYKTLPSHIANGLPYQIWRPDNQPWNCSKREPGPWKHGDRLHDLPCCRWDGLFERFVVEYPNGERVPCRWIRHHNMKAEMHGPKRAMPIDEPEEFEPDFDEDEEDNNF